MRSLICIFVLLIPAVLFGAAPTVTAKVHATATVQGDTMFLGDVCDLNGVSKDLAAKLDQVNIGRAPMDGVTRTLTVGDISLKLRQAGYDPAMISFTGATAVTVSLADQSTSVSAPAASSPVSNVTQPIAAIKPAAKSILIHSGDVVVARYEDGPVVITVDATAETAGCAGDSINIRTSLSGRVLRGTVLDAQTVLLKD